MGMTLGDLAAMMGRAMPGGAQPPPTPAGPQGGGMGMAGTALLSRQAYLQYSQAMMEQGNQPLPYQQWVQAMMQQMQQQQSGAPMQAQNPPQGGMAPQGGMTPPSSQGPQQP